jgi:hypothetical protein
MSRDARGALATFEHGKFFVLERAHDTCATYGTGDTFKRYTCYGCSERMSSNFRAAHEDEGIRDLVHCVTCHRSADKESAERGSGGYRKRVRD